MNYKQHIVFGVAVSAASQYLFHHPQALNLNADTQYYAGAFVGALVPDFLDHPGSYLGRKTWGLLMTDGVRSQIASVTHRKLTHSLLFLFSTYYLLFMYTHDFPLSFGLFVGIASHMIGDMLTPKGIPLFYPFHYIFFVFKKTKLNFLYRLVKRNYLLFPLIKSRS